jgi:tubulin epsilon
LALWEHAAYNKAARFNDALSSFFRNVDSRYEPPQELPIGGAIKTLKVTSFRRKLLLLLQTLVSLLN